MCIRDRNETPDLLAKKGTTLQGKKTLHSTRTIKRLVKNKTQEMFTNEASLVSSGKPVSYTHLDVYKRQIYSILISLLWFLYSKNILFKKTVHLKEDHKKTDMFDNKCSC